MARIELRHCDVILQDGLAGVSALDPDSAPPLDAGGSATLSLDTDETAINTTRLGSVFTGKQVPVGARFTIEGETTPLVHVVTSRSPSSGPTTSIGVSPSIGVGSYGSGSIDAILGDATTDTEGDPGEPEDEVQRIARFQNNVVSGTYTLDFDLNVGGGFDFSTAAIAYNADAATIQAAINAAATGDSVDGWTNDDIVVTGGPLTVADVVLTFSGGSVDELDHEQTEISDVDLDAVGGDVALTFLPQQLEVKIGEGEIDYTESNDYIYDLDRGDLDTVREGDQQPLELNLSFTYEHITTGTDEVIAPMDALKGKGAASEWVSSSDDPCEPYAVDILVVHTPPCGGAEGEITTFPDFRSDSRNPSFTDSTITVSGRCNAVEPTVTRFDPDA